MPTSSGSWKDPSVTVEAQRIIALANGEPVGEGCSYAVTSRGECNPSCPDCHGTGRIRTEPENDAERAVARLRKAYTTELPEALRERNEAQQALEAERAAHQRERDRVERITEGLLAEANAKLVLSVAAHEETKRQLELVKQQGASDYWIARATGAERQLAEARRASETNGKRVVELGTELEETNRQLARARERVCLWLCRYFQNGGIDHGLLCKEVRRG